MSRSPRTGATDLGHDPAAEAGTDHPDTAGTSDAGHRPHHDPGRFDPPTDPDLPIVPAYPDTGMQEATTSIFAAVPAQPGRDESLDDGWADPTWGHRSWDRPDYDDEPDEFDGPDRRSASYGHPDASYGHPGDEYFSDAPGPEVVDAEGASAHSRTRLAALLVPTVVGVAISVGLGVYARVHEGTGTAINLAGFSSGLAAKSWLTAAAFVLVLVQLWTSMRMYGRLAKRRPAGPRTATVHRWSGRLAVLLTIPVAVHCLYALGFSDANLRVLLHSLLGCFFYGVFAAKMLVLPRHDAPRWALPVLGGLVFTVLTGLFLTSSVWFFTTKGLTF